MLTFFVAQIFLITTNNAFAVDGNCARFLLVGVLGADVRSHYTHVKVRLAPSGTPHVEVGSKAFAYWRERTPPWIPDSAFAFQYLTKDEVRNSVAIQSEDPARLASMLPEAVVNAKSKEKIWDVESQPELPQQLTDQGFRTGHSLWGHWWKEAEGAQNGDSVPLRKLEYIYFENGPQPPVLFFKYEQMTHSRAEKIVQEEYPNARALFAGSMYASADFDHSDMGRPRLIPTRISIGDGSWLDGQRMTGAESLARLLIELKSYIALPDNAKVSISAGSWDAFRGPSLMDPPTLASLIDKLLPDLPLIIPGSGREIGLFDSKDILPLLSSEEARIKFNHSDLTGTEPDPEHLALDYIAISRGSSKADLVFFKKIGDRFHQRAWKTIERAYPNAILLFGGTVRVNWNKITRPDGSVAFIAMDEGGFVNNPLLEGAASFKVFLPLVSEQLKLPETTRISLFDDSWRGIHGLEHLKSLDTITIQELKKVLERAP